MFNCNEKIDNENGGTIPLEKLSSEYSGINFSNDIYPNLETRENLFDYDYFYNGSGVGIADLNNDGDLDIVYSRAGILYAGTAIQIIENLGNKSFKDQGIIPLVEAPADFIPLTEGNEWNDFIEDIRFRDLDKDGDVDLYLSSFVSLKTNGMVLLNEGGFDFKLVPPDDAKKYVDKNFKAPTPLTEEQKAEEQAIEDEIAAFEAELEAEAVTAESTESKEARGSRSRNSRIGTSSRSRNRINRIRIKRRIKITRIKLRRKKT